MPPVARILETALYVDDLARAVAFYRAIFDFPLILSAERLAALRVPGRGVLLLFKRGASIGPSARVAGVLPHDGSGPLHLAFAIAAADRADWRAWLALHEVAIEREIPGAGGSISVYFRDPDGNLLELANPGIWAMA